MGEKIYTIPVNEVFDKDCECPVCEMYDELQQDAIDFTMGTSYMQDDVRMETNRLGFCEKHVNLMYNKNQNRLGLALMLLTHMNGTIKEMEKLSKHRKPAGGLFKKDVGETKLKGYADKLECSCYICNRIDNVFERYVATIFYLYQTDDNFVKKFENCKGFCTKHYAYLFEKAETELRSDCRDSFYKNLNRLYLENMKRVRDDLKWFTDKFDYRYANEPWKNSKDALPRTITKTNSIYVEEKKRN